nr:O-antigen ligase family protein [Marinobacter sp. JH2]
MLKVSNTIYGVVVSLVIVSVLFADFLPLLVSGYDYQRFILVVLLASVVSVGIVMLLFENDGEAYREVGPALLLAVLFFVLAIPFRDAPHNWVEPALFAAFFFAFVLLGTLTKRYAQQGPWVVLFVYIFVATAFFYGACTLLVYIFVLSDRVSAISSYIPWGFANIRYWSHIATWLIPLLPLAVLIGPLKHKKLWHVIVALSAASWWWVVFLSASRGTILGVLFGSGVVIITMGRLSFPWLKVALRYLVYGLTAWIVLSILVPSLLFDGINVRSFKNQASIEVRAVQASEAWEMTLENFPFGSGPQSWLTHEIITEKYRDAPKYAHPHNMYLMWAAEYGWLLIVALLLLVGQAVRNFWARRGELFVGDRYGLALPLVAVTSSVSAALVHAGVSSVFLAPGSMLVGFIVLSLFWALISPQKLRVPVRFSFATVAAALLAGVLFGVLSCYWVRDVTAYHQAMEADELIYYESQPNGTMPRFWVHGNYPRPLSQMGKLD